VGAQSRSSLILVALVLLMAVLSVAGAFCRSWSTSDGRDARRSPSQAERLPRYSAARETPSSNAGIALDPVRFQCEAGLLPIERCPGVRRIRLGDPQVVGALSQEVVRRVVHRHRDELRACYEGRLGASARLTGRLHVQFTIASDGLVAKPMLESATLVAPGAEACVTQAIERWVFPAPAQGTAVVRFPFFLETGT
jgi:hypothetical protein